MNLNYERHYLSEVCHTMSDEDFGYFKNDILNQGVLEKQIVLMNGQILDGWHRYSAVTNLIEEGYEIEVGGKHELIFVEFEEEFEGHDPVKFVLAKNVQRRQKELSLGQRVVIVLEANEWKRHGGREYAIDSDAGAPASLSKNEKSADEMAEEVGTTNRTAIVDGKRIFRKAKEFIPRIKSGEMSLNAAVQEIRERERVESSIAELFEEAEDIAQRVVDAEITLEEGQTLLEKRREENVRLERIRPEDSDLYNRVKSGEITVYEAEAILNKRKKEAERLKEIKPEALDLYEKVKSGDMEIAKAEKTLQDRKNYVKSLGTVESDVSHVTSLVMSGEMSLDEAREEVQRLTAEFEFRKKLAKDNPDLFERLESGEMSPEEIKRVLKERAEKNAAEASRKKFVANAKRTFLPDYENLYNKVINGEMTFDVASHEMELDQKARIKEAKEKIEASNLFSDKAPDLLERVLNGEITLDTAKNVYKDRERRKREDAIRKKLESERPDLVAKVGSGELTLRDAEKIMKKERKKGKSGDSAYKLHPTANFKQIFRKRIDSLPNELNSDLTVKVATKLRRDFIRLVHSDKVDLSELSDAELRYWNHIIVEFFDKFLTDIIEGVKYRSSF